MRDREAERKKEKKRKKGKRKRGERGGKRSRHSKGGTRASDGLAEVGPLIRLVPPRPTASRPPATTASTTPASVASGEPFPRAAADSGRLLPLGRTQEGHAGTRRRSPPWDPEVGIPPRPCDTRRVSQIPFLTADYRIAAD